MGVPKYFRTYLLLIGLVIALESLQGFAQSNSDAPRINLQQPLKERDGQHGFDFEIGSWKTHLRRLLHPLTGSTTWVEYEGTTVVRKVWNGRANLVELNGRGEFFDQETLDGSAIFVRFVISDITQNSCRFEQAFSADGGKTWEVNWIATDTRVND